MRRILAGKTKPNYGGKKQMSRILAGKTNEAMFGRKN
jgi:hypothetical protein